MSRGEPAGKRLSLSPKGLHNPAQVNLPVGERSAPTGKLPWVGSAPVR